MKTKSSIISCLSVAGVADLVQQGGKEKRSERYHPA
jgi:hypothetical protein